MNNILTLITCLSLLFTFPAAHAQTATPSSDTVQKSIQDRIRRAVQENLNGGLPATQRLKAFFGSVVTISGDTITIQRTLNSSLMTYQITLTKDTKIVKGKSTDLKIENISLNDQIIAMGTTADDQTMLARRLVIKPGPETTQRTAFESNVTDLDIRKRLMTHSTNQTTQTETLSRRVLIVDSNLKPTNSPTLPALAILVRLTDSEDDTNVITSVLFPYLSASPSAVLR